MRLSLFPIRAFRTTAVAILAILLAAGCTTVGPDYRRPDVEVAPAFVETGPWTQAAPQDTVARGDWWSVFEDPILAELEERATASNPDLRAAVARVDQARAVAGIAASYQAPDINIGTNAARLGVSSTRPDQPSRRPPANQWYDSNDFKVPLYASYEVDLWGKVRRQSEAARAQLEASTAAYYAVLLTLQGDVAQTYFQICTTDAVVALLRDGVAMRRKARDVVLLRKGAGLGNAFDLARANAELAANEAEVEEVARERAQLAYRLAVLVGTLPERFKLAETAHSADAPAIPLGVPSDILQRRPDVAEAERRLVARNADIGVATAAWFPSFNLTAALGYESFDLERLIRRDSAIFNFTGALWAPVFNSGRIGLNVDRARAAYEENVGQYQSRILRAFQEVETALAGLAILSREASFESEAVANADQAMQIAGAKFKAGLISLLEVVDTQRTLLQTRRQAARIRGDRLLTTVALIKALGGGWNARSPPPTPVAKNR